MYLESGGLNLEMTFKDDLPNGVSKEYYPNGKLKTVIDYIAGKKNGSGKSYYESGKLEYELVYTNDAITQQKHYDETGALIK